MGRILVVDDEPDVLLLCRLNLQQRGHEMLEAPDGSRALELARDRHPDVIVLDLMLPGMSGYDVLEALQRDEGTSDIPVLVLTAKSLRADRERSHGLGASAFLTKPFLPNELCEMVDSLVNPEGRSLTDQTSPA
jgi:CheY-like chemotaxis protein